MVTHRQIRLALRTTALVLVGTTIGVWVWALQPAAMPDVGDPGEDRVISAAVPVASAPVSPDLDAFRPLWNKPLRRPLVDPPAPPVEPDPAKPGRNGRPRGGSPIAVTLVGTILEPGHSMAVFADAQGQVEVKGLGQTLELDPGGPTVQRIDFEQVTLAQGSEQVTLKIKPMVASAPVRRRRPIVQPSDDPNAEVIE